MKYQQIFRLCRIQTFEEYKRNTGASSSLPSSADLKCFVEFIKRKREKVFTNAHQALSIEKVEVRCHLVDQTSNLLSFVQDTYRYCLKNLEELTRKLLESNDLEEAFHLIKGIDNLGDFYAYQIVCDMVEIGLLKFRFEVFCYHYYGISVLSVMTRGPVLDLAPSKD